MRDSLGYERPSPYQTNGSVRFGGRLGMAVGRYDEQRGLTLATLRAERG